LSLAIRLCFGQFAKQKRERRILENKKKVKVHQAQNCKTAETHCL